MGACEYSTVILYDISLNKTQDAIDIAIKAAERGAKSKNSYGHVETVPFSNLDSDLSWDNYLWSMILRADSILIIASYDNKLSENVLSFLRKTTGKFIYNARVSWLLVNHNSDCRECGKNCSVSRGSANSILKRWTDRNQLHYAMDASINISGDLFCVDDLNYWKDMSYILGENLVN